MTELDLIEWISNQGFAIAVAVYLLYERTRFNSKITESLVKITETIERVEKWHTK